MKKNKLMAGVLASIMLLSTACGSAQTTVDSSAAEKSAAEETAGATQQSTEAAAQSSESADAADSNGTVHPCRIVQPGTLCDDYETGIAAVNQKLKEDGVDIEVEVIKIPWDSYNEKLNLMLSTGEPFEILQVMQDVKNISSIATMGAIIPVTDYIDKYPDLKNKFDDVAWRSTLYNGEYWAIPDYWCTFDKTMSYMIYRSDIAEKVGYEEFPDTLDGIMDLMKKSQDAIKEENGMTAYNWFHQIQDTPHWLHRSYDTYPFYVENSLGVVLARQDGTIDSYYESEEFKQDANTYYKMYHDGLIDPDILSLDHQHQYDEADFGAFLPSQTFDPNEQINIKRNTGVDAETLWARTFPDKPDMIYTYGQNMNAVSSTSEDPETAFKFFNWLYASQENFDLFHYGVEGTHYTLDENGRIDQVLNESGTAIYNMETWQTGYVPYIRYTKDTTENYIDYYTYKSDNYVVSPIAGFIFDASNVQSELTNLQTELMASIYPIKVGMVSYDENIDNAIAKLKAAGLDTYLEEYRKQFAEYLKANPDVLEEAKGNQTK